jgi:RNA polymerase sigma-70 factor (ECF subfamily)
VCDFQEGRRKPGAGSGDTDVRDLLNDVAARADLVSRLAEEYDLEVFDAAQLQVRLRVDRHTWEAFRLTALEDCSGAEAAARLNMEIATVFKAKSKVLKMLKEEVAKLDSEVEAPIPQAARRRPGA